MPTIAASPHGSAPLETARLVLRPLVAGDAAAAAAIGDDLEVAKHLSFLPHPFTEDAAAAWIASTTVRPGGRRIAAVERRTGRLIGVTGVYPDSDGGAEIGFWLGRAFWGHGFATEMAGASIDVTLSRGHDPVWATVLPGNAASIRVLAKLGFIRGGAYRKWFILRGEEVPLHRYVLDRTRPTSAAADSAQ